MNMLKPFFATGLALPLLAAAQASTLAPQAERISDAVIQQDYGAFERLQSRIKSLNDGGRRVADYHLAKAQCWLDVSFHEYTRNDRSAFPQDALTESEKLVVAMEGKQSPIANETPLVNGSARLIAAAGPTAIALAAKMAERIVGRAVTLAPETMAEIASEALAGCRPGAGTVRVRIHPDDLPAVEARRAALEAGAPLAALELVADEAVGRHGCVIETPQGRVDARLETQLAALERALTAGGRRG